MNPPLKSGSLRLPGLYPKRLSDKIKSLLEDDQVSDKILNFVQKRKEKIEVKRRHFERLLFNNFLGAHQEINQDGALHPVSLIDISPTGCLFQIPWNKKAMKKGSEINMRMYFTKQSYLPVILKIKYCREDTDDEGRRILQYGCEFDTSLPSFQAMSSFIEFLYQFAEYSKLDRNEEKVWFL